MNGSDDKESACNAGDVDSIPGSGISTRGGNGNLLQYSCQDNPMDRGVWQVTVHGVAESQTWLKQLSMHVECEVKWKKERIQTWLLVLHTFQFSLVQSCPILCDPMNCSMPGFAVHHQLPELAQTHVHRVGDAIQPSHPVLSPSLPAFSLSQHQGLFQWVSSSHQVAKVLELQHQSFQWIFRIDFL